MYASTVSIRVSLVLGNRCAVGKNVRKHNNGTKEDNTKRNESYEDEQTVCIAARTPLWRADELRLRLLVDPSEPISRI